MAFGCLSKQLPLEPTLIEQKPQILLKVLISYLLVGIEQIVEVFLVEIELEGSGYHAHFFELVVALEMSNSAFPVPKQVVLKPVGEVREGFALL